MSLRRLEVKIIKGQGVEPETFDIPIGDKDSKLSLFVFRNPTMSTKDIEELVEISKRLSGNPCGAVILGEDDSFEVYEVDIPTRYEREPVI
jgi:hypothetical protein